MLLGLGFVLWRMTRDISSVEAADPHPKPTALAVPADAESKPAPGPVASRDARIAPAAVATPRAPQKTSGSGPTVEPVVEIDAGVVDPNDTPTRREMLGLLKRQVDAIDGYVSDCVTKSNKLGVKASGAAALTLRFEHVKKKSVVVDVAVEPIDTTVKDQPLLDCLRDTGKHMVLDLPDDVTAVTATHQVDLDGGAIADHRLTALEVKQLGAPPPAP